MIIHTSLSGIGDPKQLNSVGIDIVHELSAVGVGLVNITLSDVKVRKLTQTFIARSRCSAVDI